MLSFEEKKSIFQSIKELQEKQSSKNRVDYIFRESSKKGKILATQLNPSGNGYVIGKYMDSKIVKAKDYKIDERGWINIKNFTKEQLEEVITIAINSMRSNEKPQESKKETSISKFETLVRSCLYNWLGYGNLNAPIWFLGTEEGGAEIWRNRTKTLEESLQIRSKFSLQMDFLYVWESLYNVSLNSFKGANVWRFMAAFLLYWEGKSADSKTMQEYIFLSKLLGRNDSNYFLGELMPLPKPMKSSIKPYESIWPTIQEYYKEVGEKRFSLIKETILQNPGVKLMVSYDKSLTEKFLSYFTSEMKKIKQWQYKKEQYHLYKIFIINERAIYLLSTPFFGNGNISYDGIRKAVIEVKKIVNREIEIGN